MPIRRIGPSGRSVTGLIPSDKNGRMMAFESPLERDRMLLAEFDPQVERYEEQPVRIEWRDRQSGAVRHYTPDLLIVYRPSEPDGRPSIFPRLIEVKPQWELAERLPEFRSAFLAACQYARRRGWIFKVETERTIRTPVLENVRFLLPFRRMRVEDAARRQIQLALTSLSQDGTATLGALLQAVAPTRADRLIWLPRVWSLLSTHELLSDLDQPLTEASRLRWSGQ